MGNQYILCKHTHTHETTLIQPITETLPPLPLIQTYHKTIHQFISENYLFFQNYSIIAHLLINLEQFQTIINKYPIQQTTSTQKIYLPNLTKQQFIDYKGQCLLLDFLNGQFYVGQIDCSLKSGKGLLINSKGNKYQGQWQRNIFNGKGSLQFMYPKRFYKGQWKNGKLQGPGSAIYQDGAQYQGDFIDGKKHGKGKLTFLDGATYQGCFHQDLMHGYGVLTSSKGRQIEGEWKQGKYQRVKPQRSSCTFTINQLPVI